MAKRAVSVTLHDDNLLWLKSRARTTRSRSLSETIDRIVSEARLHADIPAAAIRSVAGTIDISADDPDLDTADEQIGSLVATSLRGTGIAASAGRRPARKRRG